MQLLVSDGSGQDRSRSNLAQCELCANLPCGNWIKLMKCVIALRERESWDYPMEYVES